VKFVTYNYIYLVRDQQKVDNHSFRCFPFVSRNPLLTLKTCVQYVFNLFRKKSFW